MSFLEQGRSSPGRGMVIRLAEALAELEQYVGDMPAEPGADYAARLESLRASA